MVYSDYSHPCKHSYSLAATWLLCVLSAAQTERISIQLIVCEKSEEALMRAAARRTLEDKWLCYLFRWQWSAHEHYGRTGQTQLSPVTTLLQLHHWHTTSHLLTRPLQTLLIWLWQRQWLSDISFHYGSSPCLHQPAGHRWGKSNCKLPGWANRDRVKKAGMTG